MEPSDWSSANNEGGDKAVLCRITCQSNAKLLLSGTTCAIEISHRPFFEKKVQNNCYSMICALNVYCCFFYLSEAFMMWYS